MMFGELQIEANEYLILKTHTLLECETPSSGKVNGPTVFTSLGLFLKKQISRCFCSTKLLGGGSGKMEGG